MGFEATRHYSYANNLEQCVALFTGSGERSTSNPPLFSLLGSTTDFHKRKENKLTWITAPISSNYKRFGWIKSLTFPCLTLLLRNANVTVGSIRNIFFLAESKKRKLIRLFTVKLTGKQKRLQDVSTPSQLLLLILLQTTTCCVIFELRESEASRFTMHLAFVLS